MATNPINPALPADLPENWVYGDTVSPNGTETGLTPQHGYNYLMQQVNAAQEAANALGEAMEDVPQLEGGKIPASQLPIGTPGGAASLDETGKVPAEQLPPMDYVPNSEKGAAGGVATLDGTGKVPSAQLPSMNYIPTSEKGVANGVATLDANGKLADTQKPAYTASEVGADPVGTAAGVQANLTAHINNKSNPHGVTAGQTGALPLSGGTMTGSLKAMSSPAVGTAQVRNVYAGTSDMTAGSSTLATGTIYLVYE